MLKNISMRFACIFSIAAFMVLSIPNVDLCRVYEAHVSRDCGTVIKPLDFDYPGDNDPV